MGSKESLPTDLSSHPVVGGAEGFGLRERVQGVIASGMRSAEFIPLQL